MTEAEWLAATDPTPMLAFVRRKASGRKVRLFACHCCRAVWDRLTDRRSREAVELAERLAEERWRRQPTTPKFTSTCNDAAGACSSYPYESLEYHAAHVAVFALDRTGERVSMLYLMLKNMAADDRLRAIQLRLLADLFGNPFRPVGIDPSWLTSDVRLLAQGIYEEKAFDRMPILADALQDAGCENTDVLNHCRQQGEHVKGCWVMDSILGKG